MRYRSVIRSSYGRKIEMKYKLQMKIRTSEQTRASPRSSADIVQVHRAPADRPRWYTACAIGTTATGRSSVTLGRDLRSRYIVYTRFLVSTGAVESGARGMYTRAFIIIRAHTRRDPVYRIELFEKYVNYIY